MFRRGAARALIAALMALVVHPLGGTASAQEEMDLDQISRAMDNPLGHLWLIFMENQIQRYRGSPSDGSQWVNTLLIQPILPVPLTEKWNLVTRPILPFITAPKFELPSELFGDCPPNCDSRPPPDRLGLRNIPSSRENGWGDLMLWSMLTPAEPPKLADGSNLIWGIGPAVRLPTATEDQFGSERYSFGPSALLLRLPTAEQSWTVGLFQQHHLWSIGGDSDRSRVKTSQFQYIWWYKLPVEGSWSVGAAPMIDVNWEADNDDKWKIPVGIGVSNTFFLGKAPVRLGAEFDWFVKTSDNYGPRFMFKIYLVPVIPRLIKEPIFGSG